MKLENWIKREIKKGKKGTHIVIPTRYWGNMETGDLPTGKVYENGKIKKLKKELHGIK